jgi:hypothetical protein
MLLRQLRRRFGSVPAEIAERVGRLSDAEIGELGDALLDFRQLSDAERWFSEHAAAV